MDNLWSIVGILYTGVIPVNEQGAFSLWKQLYAYISENNLLPPQARGYFDSIHGAGIEKDTLCLFSSDPFCADVVNSRYQHLLTEVATALIGHPLDVRMAYVKPASPAAAASAAPEDPGRKFMDCLNASTEDAAIRFFFRVLRFVDHKKDTLVLWTDDPQVRSILEARYMPFLMMASRQTFEKTGRILLLSTDNLKEHILL